MLSWRWCFHEVECVWVGGRDNVVMEMVFPQGRMLCKLGFIVGQCQWCMCMFQLALYIHDKGEGVPLTDVAFLCTTEPKPECATTYTHTFPDCVSTLSLLSPPQSRLYFTASCLTQTPLHYRHLSITYTSPKQTPLHRRHLSITDTSPSQTPVHYRHLSITCTSPKQTPLHRRHLSITDTSPSQTSLHRRHLSITDTSPSQTPLHYRHLSITYTSPKQTPFHRRHLSIADTSPLQTPLHRRHFAIADTSPLQTTLHHRHLSHHIWNWWSNIGCSKTLSVWKWGTCQWLPL